MSHNSIKCVSRYVNVVNYCSASDRGFKQKLHAIRLRCVIICSVQKEHAFVDQTKALSLKPPKIG